MFKIWYEHPQVAQAEEIDSADSLFEAMDLLTEYKVAFNGVGVVWIEPPPKVPQNEDI